MIESCGVSRRDGGEELCLVTSVSMASSSKSTNGGTTADRSTSFQRKSAGGAGRGLSGAALAGAGFAAVLVVAGGYLGFGALRAPVSAGAGGSLEISVLDTEADATERRKAGRLISGSDDRQLASDTLAKAVLAMEDPALAVLPAALTEVGKSERIARKSALRDEKAVALLREALADAANERTARLALADALSRQTAALTSDIQMMAAAGLARGTTTGSISAGTMMAAYASTNDAYDLMNSPFATVMTGDDDDEAMLLPEDIPLPADRPEPPARAAAKPAPAKEAVALAKPAAPEKPTPKAPAQADSPAKHNSLFSLFNAKPSLPGPGSRIAVYDISGGVVHMPNGEKLKASSGRGSYRDNPKYVHVRNRGATPPNVYSLRMREARFHGVEAIRMTPVGSANMYGRDGFLTHTYLLRVPGDSSGCVVFADYDRFLNAFKRGHVTKLVVVPSMKELPKYMAML